MAILIAGACFLLFPLGLAVNRPQPDGWLGVIFRNFCEIDRPYNLLPSLHITLCCILAVHYARHSRGLWRAISDPGSRSLHCRLCSPTSIMSSTWRAALSSPRSVFTRCVNRRCLRR